MQPEPEPQYLHVEPLPSSTMSMQHPMEPATKEILSNIENSCSDVNGYLSMNTANNINHSTNTSELNTPTNVIDVAATCEEPVTTVAPHPPPMTSLSTNTVASTYQTSASTNSLAPMSSSLPGHNQNDDLAGGLNESVGGESLDNTSGFDMQFLDENNLTGIEPKEIHKNIGSANVSTVLG